MNKKTAGLYPKKNTDKTFPSRVYDGDKRDINLTYEELHNIINLNKTTIKFNQLRPLVHEIYNFSNGKNNINDIAKKIGFEFGLKIDPIFVLKFIEKMDELNIVKIDNLSN